jgi:hypothetical protein
MLPPFIIEQIRKREELRKQERPQIQLPLPLEEPADSMPPSSIDDSNRGVAIIDLGDIRSVINIIG